MKTLTMVDILKGASKFIKAGKLGGQRHSLCKYDYGDGCRCIVGCGMDDETFKEAGRLTNNTMPIANTGIEIAQNDFTDICDLQRAHDNWAMAKQPEKRMDVAKNRATFYKLLQQMRKKYGVAAG